MPKKKIAKKTRVKSKSSKKGVSPRKKAYKKNKNPYVMMVECFREDGSKIRLFTHKKNHPYLINFARITQSQLTKVKAENCEITELREFPSSLINPPNNDRVKFKIIKSLTPEKLQEDSPRPLIDVEKLNRNQIGSQIKSTITKEFLRKRSMSTKDIYKIFYKYEFSKNSLNRYFKLVREKLKNNGYQIKSVGRGNYEII
jgi:hypothetical protein